MKTRVITISREFGSGGRTVGKQTAKLLGIPCYGSTPPTAAGLPRPSPAAPPGAPPPRTTCGSSSAR